MDDRQYAFLARQPSAALKNRERFLGMPKRGLAFLLANVMFWQPMWAQADGIVVSAPGTGLDRAGNGVPIVNIVKPNGSGLSHNQFQDYNVGSNGVILNNATARTQSTQLGGIILGNPNLQGSAATTILNEVNGGNPSQLRGYTEVAGQSAHVIVANPYGITCNGCGFINSPKVTLSTGKPMVENGQLSRYQVDQGSVTIEGAGLNANNVDHFEIITRSAKINAEIQAKNLTIVAGRNDVNADTLNATARADDGSAKPELAIDSSALGGMYAGTIKLVGTEAGVGVKLDGKLIASGGDIQLDANGHLSLAETSASGAIDVKAASLDARGAAYAGTTLNAQTQGNLSNQQTLAARDSITLNAAGQLRNNGIIEAGVNADTTRNATGDVSLTAQSLGNSGSVIASRNLTANVAQTLSNQAGTLSSGQTATIKAETLDNQNKGRVLSGTTLNITADKLINTQGLVSSNGTLAANVGQLNNGSGELNSLSNVTLRVASLDNVAGLMAAGQMLDINASGQVNNRSGRLSASKSVQLTAASLDNTAGRVLSAGGLTAQIAGQLLNQTGLFNSGGNLQLSTAVLDNRNGEISSLANLTLSGSQADNSSNGRILANGDITLSLDNLDNQQKGQVAGQRDVQLNVGQLDNSDAGSVYAKRNLNLVVTNQLNNTQGVLRGDGTLTAQAASLGNNGGSISSLGGLSVTSSGALANQGGTLLTDAGLTLTSGSLDNSQQGRIAGNGVVLKTGAFANQQGGQLTSTGVLQLTANEVDNSSAGRIASAMALTATVTGLDQQAGGQLFSATDVSLDLNKGRLNNNGGLITAPGQLLLKNLRTVGNQGGEISSAKAFTLAAQSLDNTDGKLVSDQGLTVRIDQALANVRGAISGHGVDLRAAQLDNTDASLSSDADLSLQLSGVLLNRNGELSSAGNSTISAMTLGNGGGQITADQRLNLTISGTLDNQAGTLGAGQGLSVRAGSLDNRQAGSLVTDGNLDVTLDGLLNNQGGGSLLAKGLMNVRGLSLDNRGGRLSGLNLLTLRTTTTDNRGGVVRADKDLQLFVDQMDNRQQGLLTSKAGIGFTGQRLDNQGGLLSAVGLVQLQAGVVLNNAGRIASQSDLVANVDALTQQGGELVAQGTLTLTGASLDNSQGGLVGATKALKLNVGSIDNRAGEISSQVDVGLTGDQLNNSDGGKVLAGTALGLKVARLINQNKGLLFGSTLNLTGTRLDNVGGTLAGQHDLLLNLTADLDNRAGLLSSDGTLTLDAASVDNAKGSLSSAAALKVTTTGALNNQGGSINTDAGLTLNSATLDNQNGGVLFGKGKTQVTTGAFDNSHGGRLTSANTLDLTAAQVTNQDTGRIASAMALTGSLTGLDQQGGELFSNTALTLDLNHGQLNNQHGLINAPSALLLKNLDGVANQSGEISSAQAFSLEARTLDNSGGKLLSNQALTLRLAQAMNNVNGIISAAALNTRSASLDNTGGLISSRDELDLQVDNHFTNHQGTVVADGNLLLDAVTADNSQGQIASKKDLSATLGSLQQQGGQLIAQGKLSLTGNSLDNRANGLVGATGALDIKVGDIDNRGGELSSQGALSLVGQQLDNSDSGQILAQDTLALKVDQIINRNKGLLSGKTGLSVIGSELDNTSGAVLSAKSIDVNLGATLDNSLGLFSSEGSLGIRAGSLINTAGSLSSAGALSVNSVGAISNQGGQLITDADLDLHSASLDNRQGSISGKGAVSVTTGQFDNSHGGQLNSASTLSLDAGKVTNQDNGRIGSTGALTANVTGLDQQGGRLFSSTHLDLDLHNGHLNNQNGLINAPILVLKNLAEVTNQNGEISSAQAFALTADRLDNSNGKLLGNQGITLRIAQALTNVKGLIAAASLDVKAGSLDNSGGILNSRGDLMLNVDGVLTNKGDGLINAAQALNISSADLDNQGGQVLAVTDLTLNATALDNRGNGLINSQGTLSLTANSLDSSNGGEVSAKGDIGLNLSALTQNGGRLLGNAGISLDLGGGDLNNSSGLMTAKGPLTISRLRDLNNRGGEISSSQSFTLAGRTLDNTGGKLISSNLLNLDGNSLLNQNGLISGWQGLQVNGSSLDNRNNGTLSSRNGDVGVILSGALLNSAAGALVGQKKLTVSAASLDNSSGGILSSGGDQTLTVTGGLLNNAQGGLIDSGALLVMNAMTLGNVGGTVNAQKALSFTGTTLDNSGGKLIGNAAVTLDLLGALTNTSGKIASVGPLRVERTTQINNQGGQIASQGLLTLLTDGLDNRNRGTVAANDLLVLNTSGAVQNDTDGLIYSQNGGVEIDATSLTNGKGVVQSQGDLKLTVDTDIDNQSGRIQAKAGDVTVTGRHLDNRGGVLASLQGLLTTQLTGVLKNGYDLNNNRQGGITQAQRLNLTARGGFDNYGGRISAQSGDAIVVTRNFDNRNGGLYAKGKVNVTGNDFDNSGDNDGQIAGSQIDLNLTGALNNRLGIIESDSTLAIKAASLDNQTGQLRALGASGKTNFQIGGLFDNRNGTLETANSDLTLGAGSFLNSGGSLLHVGTGTFDISTANVIGAGGTLVTRGGLTIGTDSWTNSGVIQAGRLNVNVNNFTQTASGQLLASDSFSGSGVNWFNEGLVASNGSLKVDLSGAYWGAGRLSSQGILGLDAAQVSLNNSNSSIAGGGSTTLNINGQLDNIGRLTSATNLTVNAVGVNNLGTLGGAQLLTVTAGSLVNNQGLIFSGGDMSLRVNTLNNLSANIYSLGNLTVDRNGQGALASSIVNSSSSIQSDGSMSLAASTIQNFRTLLTTGSSGIYTAKIYEIACIEGYNAGDCSGKQNHVWELLQREKTEVTAASAASSITAGGNLTLNGGNLLNQSSTIASGGNLTASLVNLTNSGIETGETETTRVFRSERTRNAGGWYNAASNFTNLFWYESAGYNANNLGGLEAGIANFIGMTEMEYTNLGSTKKIAGGDQSYAAVIQAGGAVNISTQNNIDNSVVRPGYTYVGSGPRTGTSAPGSQYSTRITLNQQLPPTLAQQQVNPVALPGFSLPTGQNGLFRLSGQGGSGTQASQANVAAPNWIFTGASVAQVQRNQSVPDVQARDIQLGAGTQVSAASRQAIANVRQSAGIDGNASTVSVSAPADSGATGISVPGHTPDAAGMTVVGGVSGSNLAGQPAVVGVLPASAGATNTSTVFTQMTTAGSQSIARVQGLPSNASQSKPQKYLIETNPVLTDLKQFMSSDYLLGNLGYDPDQSAKRLGDGLYEQTLIQQAVVARTGQRFIDGQTSNEDMFKYLMNNAIASKQELNLSIGVSLTSEQVAALTHDIVWMENVEVNGEQVLVPVLYLANANNRLAANGALIQGSDVTLIAGKDLNNAGTLRASNNLSATATNDLVNSGLVEAGNRLDLLAGNNLVNKAGGIIAGRDVTLSATRGDVINERTVTTHESDSGYRRERTDFIDSASRIEAANNLTISAGRDINNVGGVLKSGADTTLNATRDVNLTSAERITSGNRGTHRDETITQYGSSLDIGRDLTANAGRDLTAVASQIDAKRDISMNAIGDLTLASAADEQHSYGKSKKVTAQEDHVSQVSTSVTAGGNVALSAGKDLGLIASRVSAGDEAYLVAGANLVLQSAEDSDYSFYSKTKKSSSGKKFRLDETSSITNVASSVTSGGNNVLTAGNDLLIKGSNVTSEKGSVGLGAGNDVEIVAVTDSESARHERSQSKSSWGGLKSSKVKDQLAETQTTAVGSLISGDTIAVVAKRDATVTGSALVSTDDLTVRAGRDLTIDAAENTFSRTQVHKEKNRDFTGILTANNLGIDDITGNQHLSISNQKHNGTASQTTLTGSTIGSSKGSVSLVAGGDLNVIASDLVSTKDMSLRGSNVTIAAGMETAKQSTVDKSNSLAVGRVVGGAIIDTVNTIRSSVEAAKDADDPRLKAVKLAQAALAAYNLGGMASDANDQKTGFADKQGGTASNGSLIKIGTELANTHSKSTSDYASQTAKQSTLNAGTTLSIIAHGNAAENDGDLHVIGSSIKAANTSLLASNNIILESAQNTADWSNHNSNNKTAIGASFNIGQQNGFTLDLGAQLAKGMGNGSSVTQVNTTVDTGSLLLRSGGDTTLAGAQVRADEIKALIDGNLNIISRQDTQDQKSKQSSGGFGASICIPPFCYGTPVAASANLAAGNMNSEYKGVTDQTGLFAGTGGYTVDVGKTTTLEGGVIASDASADKNTLITDRLIARDIKNISEIEAQSAGISISGSYGGAGATASVGGLYGIALSESDKSHTRSAVSEGTIIVRKPEGAQDTVGLNRDTKNANEHLDKPDEEAMKERVELIKSSVELVKGVGDAIAAAKIKEAKDQNSEVFKAAHQKLLDNGVADPSSEQVAKQVQSDYGVGSSFQKASQAVSAIVQGLIGGNIGGAIGGAAAPYLAQTVKDMTEGDATANLMAHAVLGAVIARAGGNSALAGATGAVAAEVTARLIREELYGELSDEELTQDQKQTISALATLAAGIGGAVTGKDALSAVASAQVGKNAVENNFLSPADQTLLDRLRQQRLNGDTRVSVAKKLVELDKLDQISNALMERYRLHSDTMSDADKAQLNAYLQEYTYALINAYGPEAAQAKINAMTRKVPLKQSDTVAYASYGADKQASLDRLYPGGILDQMNRPLSQNEQLYLDSLGTLRINQDYQALADVGTPALYVMSGSLGAGIRLLAAESGALQIAYGGVQAYNGDAWAAAGNIVMGALNVVGSGAAGGLKGGVVGSGAKSTDALTASNLGRSDLGDLLGRGGNKDVYAYGDNQAVGVLRNGTDSQSISDEIEMLGKLRDVGVPTVNPQAVVVDGIPGILMDKFAQGSKDIVKLVDGKVRIVGDSPLLNQRSVSDLQSIRSKLVDNNIQVNDLQFLIGREGRIVVADPLAVNFNTSPSKNNLRMIDLLIQVAQKNGPFNGR
ncbi:two-partner secretion domain-containing protein [Pseudomonas sp. H1_F01]